jgi:hypothetical protein
MPKPIPLEWLKVIPYLDTAQMDGRTVNLMPLWDGKRWRQWVSTSVGVIEINVVDMIEGDYVAVAPCKESDLFIPFIDLMWQRASWPTVCPVIVAICDDFRKMGVSIAKLRFFFDHRESTPSMAASRFAQSELEYLLIVSRSVFDLVHEVISKLWRNNVKLLDESADANRRAHGLPETFSKLVLRDKREPRTSADIQQRYGLPEPLAAQYASLAPFFSQIRGARDAIVHAGSETGDVFDTERGFCVDPKAKPFSWLQGWRPEHYYNENLVSVLPWVADLVMKTIDACNRLTNAFASVIRFPPESAPGYRVFVRGPQNDALLEAMRVHAGATPWWNERVSAAL